MKIFYTFIFLSLSLTLTSQTIQTTVNNSGIQLIDDLDEEHIILDGTNKCVVIHINDSLTLKIQGGALSFVKLLNNASLKETGMEMDHDGAFGFGEFQILAPEFQQPVTNIQNGIFRPAPNTQALATDSQERLRISPDGKIGINTIEPTERLDVEGRLRLRSLEEDMVSEDILVVDILGVVRKRPFFTFPPPPNAQSQVFKMLDSQNEMIKKLMHRIAVLEKKQMANN